MASILVTGAAGFLGRALVPRLRAEGWKILAPDLRREPLPARADAVVHLAQSPGKTPAMWKASAGLTKDLLAWAPGAGVRTFLLASSGSALGPRSGQARPGLALEDDLPAPADAYGLAKLAAEAAVLHSGLERALVVRLYTLFGPGQGPERLVPRLEAAVREGRPVEVAAPDGIRLTPTHVDDAAEGLLRCLACPDAAGILHLAGPEALTVGEMARRLGASPRIVPRPPRRGEGDLAGDASRLAAVTGWRPSKRFGGLR